MDSILPYIDGVAVTIITYAISPPEDALRNAAAVGLVHFALHEYACDQLNRKHLKEKTVGKLVKDEAPKPNSFNFQS